MPRLIHTHIVIGGWFSVRLINSGCYYCTKTPVSPTTSFVFLILLGPRFATLGVWCLRFRSLGLFLLFLRFRVWVWGLWLWGFRVSGFRKTCAMDSQAVPEVFTTALACLRLKSLGHVGLLTSTNHPPTIHQYLHILQATCSICIVHQSSTADPLTMTRSAGTPEIVMFLGEMMRFAIHKAWDSSGGTHPNHHLNIFRGKICWEVCWGLATAACPHPTSRIRRFFGPTDCFTVSREMRKPASAKANM